MPLMLNLNRNALFLDIDGTLLDIAPTPESVRVPSDLIAALAKLQLDLGGALALISGRELAAIDALFAPLALAAAGVHGAEWRIAPGGHREEAPALPTTLREQVRNLCAKYPGVLLEDKGHALAVHYRQANLRRSVLQDHLKGLIAETDEPLALLHGKKVLEIVRPTCNKGLALERFMQHPPFAGRKPIFLGDDETDSWAINACLNRDGMGFRVGETADFSEPEDVRRWLREQAGIAPQPLDASIGKVLPPSLGR